MGNKGLRIRLQRYCFVDVELNVPEEVPDGQVAADVLGDVLKGADDQPWQLAPLSQQYILVKSVTRIPATTHQGIDALTTEADPVYAVDEDEDDGVPIEDIAIPPDGLEIDDGEASLPPEGMEVHDDGPAIPFDGLALTDEQAAELERHERGGDEDEEVL